MNPILIPIFLTVVFVAYMIITDKMVGTAYSISDSWYTWKKKNYSSAFIIFLSCIALGVVMAVEHIDFKHEVLTPILLIVGSFCAYGIGIYANFKQTKSYSFGHVLFSTLTFALIHIAWFIEGVKFPLYSFVLIAVVFLFIDVPKRTTVVEVVGIALAIMGMYYLV